MIMQKRFPVYCRLFMRMNKDSDGTKSDPGNHSSAWNNSSGEWFSLFFFFNLEELSDHGVHPIRV